MVTTQEQNQAREALRREIARHTRLISNYEANIERAKATEGGEREIVHCTFEIEQCRKAITAAAAELGVRPAEEKRKPGRPPKNPLDYT